MTGLHCSRGLTSNGAVWTYANRMFGGYGPYYPVYYTPYYPTAGGSGCTWFLYSRWTFYYPNYPLADMDGYGCPVGGGGFLSFGGDPLIAGIITAATDVIWCKDCPSSLECKAGSYISYTCTVNGTTKPAECTRCTPGKYAANSNQSACLECPAGTYSNNIGLSSCTPCSPGTFSAAGATSCSPCATGSYSPYNGSSLCLPCEPGTYSNTTENSLCTPCESGTVNPSTGVSSCVECANGHFAPVMGMTQCTACINE